MPLDVHWDIAMVMTIDSYKHIDAFDLCVDDCDGLLSDFVLLAQVDGLVDFYEQHVPVKARVSKSNTK